MRSKIALTSLIIGCAVCWSWTACAQADTAAPGQLAQALSPFAPPPAPATAAPPSAPAEPGAQTAADPIGSVATLQGSASVTHNNAATALKLRDPISKGDVLQTGVNGTLGITFDDDTTFTLQPNSRIAVDDFVYQEGGAGNAAAFNILRGTVAFVASAVAKSGNMKIETPTASLGIRGTTGLVEIPEGTASGTNGQVAVKLYPDADGRVGRIEVVGRDGAQLGVLSRGATGFAIRPGAAGAPGRFTAVPLQISAQEAARDTLFVRQAFSAQRLGHQINLQRRNLRQRNLRQPPGLIPRRGLGTPPGLPQRPRRRYQDR